jgi:hypothetical protein
VVQGWKRVDVEEFVTRGDEGIMVLRKQFKVSAKKIKVKRQCVPTSADAPR